MNGQCVLIILGFWAAACKDWALKATSSSYFCPPRVDHPEHNEDVAAATPWRRPSCESSLRTADGLHQTQPSLRQRQETQKAGQDSWREERARGSVISARINNLVPVWTRLLRSILASDKHPRELERWHGSAVLPSLESANTVKSSQVTVKAQSSQCLQASIYIRRMTHWPHTKRRKSGLVFLSHQRVSNISKVSSKEPLEDLTLKVTLPRIAGPWSTCTGKHT